MVWGILKEKKKKQIQKPKPKAKPRLLHPEASALGPLWLCDLWEALPSSLSPQVSLLWGWVFSRYLLRPLLAVTETHLWGLLWSEPVSVPLPENAPDGEHPGRSEDVLRLHQLLQQSVNTWLIPAVVSLNYAAGQLVKKNPRSISKASKVKIALEYVHSGQLSHKRIKLNWSPKVFGESKHP